MLWLPFLLSVISVHIFLGTSPSEGDSLELVWCEIYIYSFKRNNMFVYLGYVFYEKNCILYFVVSSMTALDSTS